MPHTPPLTTGTTLHAPVVSNVKPSEKLIQRCLADAASACVATMSVAPIICLIDRSIIENASGRSKSVLSSVQTALWELAHRPHRFIISKPFGLIYMVYSTTYLAANLLDTATSVRSSAPITAVSAGPAKFFTTSSTNVGLSLIKDRSFARMYGTGSPRPVALPTLALFAGRDALTIFASFNLPPVIASYMPRTSMLSQLGAAQLIAPAAIQVLSTPLHLLGLDLYNRNGSVAMKERLLEVRVNYVQSVVARMCRIVPAFGVGGNVNRWARGRLMGMVG